jgi:hypothetical protein
MKIVSTEHANYNVGGYLTVDPAPSTIKISSFVEYIWYNKRGVSSTSYDEGRIDVYGKDLELGECIYYNVINEMIPSLEALINKSRALNTSEETVGHYISCVPSFAKYDEKSASIAVDRKALKELDRQGLFDLFKTLAIALDRTYTIYVSYSHPICI